MIELLNRLSGHLDAKLQVLSDIKKYNEELHMFLVQNHSAEEIDAMLMEMDPLAERLTQLDAEFKQIYPELTKNIEQIQNNCSPELKSIQVKNSKINILEQQLAEMDRENRSLVEQVLKKERLTIKQGRQGSKAAYGYYQNMNGMGLEQSHLWDSKH